MLRACGRVGVWACGRVGGNRAMGARSTQHAARSTQHAALCVPDAARALAKGYAVQTGQTPAQRQRQFYPDTDHRVIFPCHKDFVPKVLALLVR